MSRTSAVVWLVAAFLLFNLLVLVTFHSDDLFPEPLRQRYLPSTQMEQRGLPELAEEVPLVTDLNEAIVLPRQSALSLLLFWFRGFSCVSLCSLSARPAHA